MAIHLLTEQYAPEFHALRLRSLREHPEAYGSSFEEEQHLGVEQVAHQLGEGLPDSFTLGARVDGTLVGILSLFRFPRRKTRHKAILGGMYVAPKARRQGIGKALLDVTLERAQTQKGLEDLTLAVTVGNTQARSLYIHSGFVPYGIEPRYIKVEDRYFDIEWMIRSVR